LDVASGGYGQNGCVSPISSEEYKNVAILMPFSETNILLTGSGVILENDYSFTGVIDRLLYGTKFRLKKEKENLSLTNVFGGSLEKWIFSIVERNSDDCTSHTPIIK
jgi:hypothetical protein